MTSHNSEDGALKLFALACEKMNEYARKLRDSSQFESVKTGADIRYYRNGWRLEKWVEAKLYRCEGVSAAWWLELGPQDIGWVIESHLAVSPDIFFFGMEARTASSLIELQKVLSDVVDELKEALERNKPFADEVTKRMR